MQPVYVKKSNPRERSTWMDNFIALEPKGGVQDVIEMAHNGKARAAFRAIFRIATHGSEVAA